MAASDSPVVLDQGGFNGMRMTRHGPLVYNKNDIFIGRALEKYGEALWLEQVFLRQMVGPRDVVVEAGANIGVHTVGLAKRLEPGGILMAFEPQRFPFQALCANLALNQCLNVWAFNEAVGMNDGDIRVPVLDPRILTNFGGLSLVGAGVGDRVRVRTIDSLALQGCRLIKADVEGMELEVLKGAVETIRSYRPILYLENDIENKSRPLIEFVFELGYIAFWHLPLLFNPENYAGDSEDIYPGIASMNMLCLPKESDISVKDLPSVTSAAETWKDVIKKA